MYKIKVGDKIKINQLATFNHNQYYDIGFTGRVTEVLSHALLVNFDQQTSYLKKFSVTVTTWWVPMELCELVEDSNEVL